MQNTTRVVVGRVFVSPSKLQDDLDSCNEVCVVFKFPVSGKRSKAGRKILWDTQNKTKSQVVDSIGLDLFLAAMFVLTTLSLKASHKAHIGPPVKMAVQTGMAHPFAQLHKNWN